MSRWDELCGVDSTTRAAVEMAVEGRERELLGVSETALREALESLDACRRHGCRSHEREDDARDLLDRLWERAVDERDAAEASDERGGCDACRAALGCGQCNGLQGGM